MGKQPDSPLHGVGHTVAYLRRLGPEYFALVLKYSEWVLTEDPDEGLEVRATPADRSPAAPGRRRDRVGSVRGAAWGARAGV